MSGLPYGARKPVFEVSPGQTSGTVTLRMKDGTRGASIFFTTDGWTPSPASTRYEGPVELDRSTTVRAVAIAPGALRSGVAIAAVNVPSFSPLKVPSAAQVVESLAPGTPVVLTFTAPVTSKGLSIGDKLPVALAEDVLVGGKVMAEAGKPVLVTVSQVNPSGHGGAPGFVAFSVRSLTLNDGKEVPLIGGELQEAEPVSRAYIATLAIPLGPIFVKGKEAVIPQGAMVTAHIATATPRRPN